MCPTDVPNFNNPELYQRWCMDAVTGRITVSRSALEWAIAQLHAYRYGGWPRQYQRRKAIGRSVGRMVDATEA